MEKYDIKMEKFYIKGETRAAAIARLSDIIAFLRSENGCPWDQVQTHESLKACLIEEAYEVIDAIENKDMDNLEEELGDLLLQIVFHAQIASESGDFDLKTLANREADKMISRHPHVFINNTNESIDKALEKWENVKRKEKNQTTHSESMRRIPKNLPALMKSVKIQKKAAHVGFDWDDIRDAFDKVYEETQELLDIHKAGDSAHIKEEVGDLLFAVVNVARFLKVDPEEALNEASLKFIDRFDFIETRSKACGKVLEEMTLDQMDEFWNLAKIELKPVK